MNRGNFNEQDKQRLGGFNKGKAWDRCGANLHRFQKHSCRSYPQAAFSI